MDVDLDLDVDLDVDLDLDRSALQPVVSIRHSCVQVQVDGQVQV